MCNKYHIIKKTIKDLTISQNLDITLGDDMATLEKLMYSIMSGTQDCNIKFTDLQKILDVLGFQCRVKGDHFIYWKDGVTEIINLQPNGNKAKAYQVKQIRSLILKYKLEV